MSGEGLLSGVMFGAVVIFFVVVLALLTHAVLDYRRISRRMNKPVEYVGREEHEEAWSDKFCADCGQGLVRYSCQNGFDIDTGLPAMTSFYACPATPRGDTRYCGNTKRTALARECAHDEVDMSCAYCLNKLVSADVLTAEDARSLRKS